MKIVYATIAVHEKYHKISRELLDTFVKYTTDSLLLVLTDDVNFYQSYSQYKNIIILEDKTLVTNVPSINLNVKYKLLQKAYEYSPSHIVLIDCDGYITNHVDNKWFDSLHEGISVCIGDQLPTNRIQNPTIRAKILALDPNVNKIWKMAREGTLLFTINNNFYKFTEEWGKLYQFVLDNKLTITSEIFEINLSSERSGYPINELGIHPLRSVIWMRERLGGDRTAIAPALR